MNSVISSDDYSLARQYIIASETINILMADIVRVHAYAVTYVHMHDDRGLTSLTIIMYANYRPNSCTALNELTSRKFKLSS